MNCYLVRSSVGSRILGIFWAETVERLWWLVDQANADPSLCEYAELTSGFLAFTGEDEPIAAPFEDGEARRFVWARAEPSEALVEALHRPSTIAWKRLPQAGEPGSGLFLHAAHDRGPGSAGRS